jgi:hypothetical protein
MVINPININTIRIFVFFIFIVCIGSSQTYSQEIAIGQWRHHLPKRTVVSIDEKPGFIYAATPYGLMEYDKEYNSIRVYDKVSGLSDFGINVIKYTQEKDLLLMGYEDGGIDVLSNGRFFTISDIKQANILGSKKINNIFIDQSRAYLSCDFGIVVLDLDLFVILDTWLIGPEGSIVNVYDVLKTENHLYAATEAGLLRADANAPNFADYRYWLAIDGFPAGKVNFVLNHNNAVYANRSLSDSDTLYRYINNTWEVFNPYGEDGYFTPKTSIKSQYGYLISSSEGSIDAFDSDGLPVKRLTVYAGRVVNANDILLDEELNWWGADNGWGLMKGNLEGNFEFIFPDGPSSNHSFGLAHQGSTLWLAPGGIIGGMANTFNDRGVYLLHEGSWNVFNRFQFPEINRVRDFHQVTPKLGNPNRAYFSAFSGGLAEFDVNEGLIVLFNEENSTLQKRSGINDIIRVGGSAYDNRGNLWVSNSDADHFLSVLKTDGTWMSYPHNGNISMNESLGRVIVDNSDQKWVEMPRGGGILVFKETSLDNNQSFDIRKLGTQDGNGALPSGQVTALAKDKDGYIWVGTNEGVVVFYSPQAALRGQAFNAQSIIVVEDGFAGRLFENETINTIFVDGSNKKWFGTINSGAFLLSPDGRETIEHFTRNNSPLPSNNIIDISVDPETGEVFFATDRGLVSYRGFATEGQAQHTDVYAFPNPVRPGYSGYIAIKGLVTNARVKITDIAGNLVYDGFAEGGQFIWDGQGLHGKKPSSGVYLVFSTNPDGEETMVTKILFMQ